MEVLTPALQVDCDYHDDHQHNLLAGFIQVLRNAFDGLKKFYNSPSGLICEPCGYRSNKHTLIDRPFPYKDSYNNGGVECAFRYKLRLVQHALIFLAEHTGPKANAKLIVVKFTWTYLEVVHRLLADNGFVPKLIAVEDLVGGWKMVVMEYLSGWEMLGEKPYEEQLKHKEKLKKALRIIHDQGFVHSDIQWPNILVSKDEINFVDFDHCGKEGVQRYQQEWDHTHCLEDAKEGNLMMRTHDDRMLERIFDQSY